MSNFHIFEDSIAADTQPASNSLPNPPNFLPNLLPVYDCSCCFKEKANTEFSQDELLLATSTPLRESTNEPNVSRKRKRNDPMCRTCQENRKKRSQKHSQQRRAKADERKQQEKVPWKDIIRMIEDGFGFYLLFVLTLVRFQLNNFCLFPTFFRTFHLALYNRIILQLQRKSERQ